MFHVEQWWAPYLWRPFDPHSWTCWTLCRTALAEHFGVDVPEWGEIYPAKPDVVAQAVVAEQREGGWLPVALGDERPGDVCSFLVAGVPAHAALVVARGDVVHVSESFATRVDRIATVNRITRLHGIWRHPALAD
jgi:cell wall-associated NlpC family hydrolase